MTTELNDSDFEGVNLKEKQTLAVLFTAKWCPFCIMFNPVFESALNEKQIPCALVDLTDFRNPLWERFEIGVVPTVIVFRNGTVTFREDGKLGRGLSRAVLQDVIRELSIQSS